MSTTTATSGIAAAENGAPARAGGAVLTADDIVRLLPHRFPFLMLDRITALEPGVSAEAVKNISASDPVLAGHFPGRMLYPGVLLVECVAQLAAVMYGTGAILRAGGNLGGPLPDVTGRVGYLAEIKQAKFLRPTYPGDQVLLKAANGARLGDLISVTGQASVGRDLVMTVRLVVTERDEER